MSQCEEVLQYLKEHPNEKLTAKQIAKKIIARHHDKYEKKKEKGKKTKANYNLTTVVAGEVGSGYCRDWQGKHPELKTTGDRPRKFYYSERPGSAEVAVAESRSDATDTSVADATVTSTTDATDASVADATDASVADAMDPVDTHATKLSEHDLYPKLTHYLWKEFKVNSKRIDEKRSSNKHGMKGSNRWLYPDVVGMEDLSSDWHQEVRDCVKQYSDKRAKLWSFEVKLRINRSNVRECFFQAVSNSSWANFGYLVAAKITGKGTLKELRMLTAVHGIGLIELKVDAPVKSQVIIPARERVGIDWDTCNRLATENNDFLEYVELVRQFYQTGKTWAKFWDPR